MAQQADPREPNKPETRTESQKTTESKKPPQPAIREIYSDWAMI